MNVFDEKNSLNLNFILQDNLDKDLHAEQQYSQTVVIAYLYYVDDLDYYFKRLDQIDEKINLVVITSLEECLEQINSHFNSRANFVSVKKPNVGRDVSALLIASKPFIEKYEYVCFLHDKREHNEIVKADTELWIENIWGNLIKNENYVNQIISLMERRGDIGVLTPPMPIGKNFSTWFGFGWHGSYEATKTLADRLGLQCEIVSDKPPITIGTALWFRAEAMKPLLEYEWKYDDFDDIKLNEHNYLSYGVERIFAYVAQSMGYHTAEIMNVEYAQKQNSFIQYSASELFKAANSFFPISNLAMLEKYEESIGEIVDFCRDDSDIYIYGSGNMGRFVNTLLRRNGVEVRGFIDSNTSKQGQLIDMVKVFDIDDIDKAKSKVICAIVDEKAQTEVERKLIETKIASYYIYMK